MDDGVDALQEAAIALLNLITKRLLDQVQLAEWNVHACHSLLLELKDVVGDVARQEVVGVLVWILAKLRLLKFFPCDHVELQREWLQVLDL